VGTAGPGGGGQGQSPVGGFTAGTPGLGGGGGASRNCQGPLSRAGNGGSGVVILSVPTVSYPGFAPGATVTTPANTPGQTILTYTAPPSAPATYTYIG
jgi:hypothetical protein